MTESVVELGWLGGSRSDGRGRLHFWPGVGIIAPQTRNRDGGWRCELVAAHGDAPAGWAGISDEELAGLATTIRLDAGDADMVALLWQTRVRQRWPGGHTPLVARVLAEQLRPAGSVIVVLGWPAVLHLMRQSNCRRDGLRRIVNGLHAAGYLSTDTAAAVEPTAPVLRLTLPDNAEPMMWCTSHDQRRCRSTKSSDPSATVFNMTSQVAGLVPANEQRGDGGR